MTYGKQSNQKTDFFALYENKNSKKKSVDLSELFEPQNQTTTVTAKIATPQTPIKIYTDEDQLRRLQLQKTKEELHLLSTNQHQKVNQITEETYHKKREEFINIKKLLESEMSTKRYTRAS